MSLIAATAHYTPKGDASKLWDLYLSVKVFAASGRAQDAVLAEAMAIVPVDTGALADSLRKEQIEDTGKQVIASVSANMPYSAYVEFGTGRRGAETGGDPSITYTMSWPGMAAQPYLRPALDATRATVLSEFGQ